MVPVLAAVIDFAGTLLIVAYLGHTLLLLAVRRVGVEQARLAMSEGIVFALSFKLAATLLKTVMLQSWADIAGFATIFALRALIKATLAFDRRRLEGADTDGAKESRTRGAFYPSRGFHP